MGARLDREVDPDTPLVTFFKMATSPLEKV